MLLIYHAMPMPRLKTSQHQNLSSPATLTYQLLSSFQERSQKPAIIPTPDSSRRLLARPHSRAHSASSGTPARERSACRSRPVALVGLAASRHPARYLAPRLCAFAAIISRLADHQVGRTYSAICLLRPMHEANDPHGPEAGGGQRQLGCAGHCLRM